MERHELEAWLGPALAELTPEQVDRLHQEAEKLEEQWPDPSDADVRELALSASVQYLLGELTVEEACKRWRDIRGEERRAQVRAIQVAVMAEKDGMSADELTRMTGVVWW